MTFRLLWRTAKMLKKHQWLSNTSRNELHSHTSKKGKIYSKIFLGLINLSCISLSHGFCTQPHPLHYLSLSFSLCLCLSLSTLEWTQLSSRSTSRYYNSLCLRNRLKTGQRGLLWFSLRPFSFGLLYFPTWNPRNK